MFIVIYGLEIFILLRIFTIFRLFLQFLCENIPWRVFETVLALLFPLKVPWMAQNT